MSILVSISLRSNTASALTMTGRRCVELPCGRTDECCSTEVGASEFCRSACMPRCLQSTPINSTAPWFASFVVTRFLSNDRTYGVQSIIVGAKAVEWLEIDRSTAIDTGRARLIHRRHPTEISPALKSLPHPFTTAPRYSQVYSVQI